MIRLCRARDLLRESFDRAVSIEDAAGAASLSPYHFIRRYKAVFGETPRQARIAARLDKAKELLMASDLSVTEVCMALGFSSVGTFSYAFLRRVGASPSDYRRRRRSMVQVPASAMSSVTQGCLSLMWHWSNDAQFSRSVPLEAALHSTHSKRVNE